MIKAHILACPICDKYLRKTDHNSGEIRKTCSNKHHIFIMNINDWDDLLSVSLLSSELHGNKFTWNCVNQILVVERLDGKSSYNLPWFEPDFYLYNKLIHKLNVYVTFS